MFVSAGVETVSRFANGMSDGLPGTHNAAVLRGRGAHREAQRGRPGRRGHRSTACPTSTSRWARPPRTSPSTRSVTREEMDEFAALSQNRAVAVAGERLLRARDHPGHARRTARSSPRTTARGRTRPSRSSPTLKPVFRPDGTVTAGNACPLNDGAAAVIVMSDTTAERARHHAAGAHRRRAACRALNPEIMGLGPIEASRQALGRAGMTIDDIDLVEINEAFAAQVIPSAQRPRHPVGEAQRERRRDRARSPVRHDRRPHHDDAAQRPRGRRHDATASRRCASAAARAWP